MSTPTSPPTAPEPSLAPRHAPPSGLAHRAPPSGLALILTFLALLVLAGASWAAAALGTGTAVALSIAALKAALIALIFMELTRAHSTDRVIALVAALFVILLCVGSIADVAFR
jgi:cytochrome c oxidase subunit 4